MGKEIKGIFKKTGEGDHGKYHIIADGQGQFAFFSADKVIGFFPKNPVQWQEVIITVDDNYSPRWKAESASYYNPQDYVDKVITLPKHQTVRAPSLRVEESVEITTPKTMDGLVDILTKIYNVLLNIHDTMRPTEHGSSDGLPKVEFRR